MNSSFDQFDQKIKSLLNDKVVLSGGKIYSIEEKFYYTLVGLCLFVVANLFPTNDLSVYSTFCKSLSSTVPPEIGTFSSDELSELSSLTRLVAAELRKPDGSRLFSLNRLFFKELLDLSSESSDVLRNYSMQKSSLNTLFFVLLWTFKGYILNPMSKVSMIRRLSFVVGYSRVLIYTVLMSDPSTDRRELVYARTNPGVQIVLPPDEEFEFKLDRMLKQDFKNVSWSVKKQCINMQRASTIRTISNLNLLTTLEQEKQHVLSIGQTAMQYANLISMFAFQTNLAAKYLDSRRGMIVKDNLEFYSSGLISVGLLVHEMRKLKNLDHVTPTEKLISCIVSALSAVLSLLVNTWLNKVSLISPRILLTLVASSGSLVLEIESLFRGDRFERSHRLNYGLSCLWGLVYFIFTVSVYSTDLILMLRHEQNKNCVDKNKLKLLKNIKTLMFLTLTRQVVVKLFSSLMQKQKYETLHFILGNMFGSDESIYSLVSNKKWKELGFSLVSTNLIILVINFFFVEHVMENLALDLQAKQLQKFKRTLLNCRGGLSETRRELQKFNRTHNVKNTALLLIIFNLGNLVRLPYFGNGTNVLNFTECFINIKTELRDLTKSQRGHAICRAYPEYYS